MAFTNYEANFSAVQASGDEEGLSKHFQKSTEGRYAPAGSPTCRADSR